MFHRFTDAMTDKMDIVLDWIMDRLALFWSVVVVTVIAGVALISGTVSSMLPGYTGEGVITATEIRGSECYLKVKTEDGSEGEFPFGARWKCKEKDVEPGVVVKINHGKATESMSTILKNVSQ